MQNILPGGPHHWLHWTLDTWHVTHVVWFHIVWCVMPHAGSGRCVCVLSRQLLAPPPPCSPAHGSLHVTLSGLQLCRWPGPYPGHTFLSSQISDTRGGAVDPGWGRGLRDAICAFPQTINPPNIRFPQFWHPYCDELRIFRDAAC